MNAIGGDPILKTLVQILDVAARRQEATAANIANLDTPGYRTQDFDFRAALRLAVSGAPPESVRMASRPMAMGNLRVGPDGNDVDLDREMIRLNQTLGFYSAATELFRRRAALLRYAISEGRS